MSRLIICAFVLLAACATPREQCTLEATKDLRVLDELIAQTERNIERGYGTERDIEPRVHLTFCHRPSDGFQWCRRQTTQVVERPVAIDLDAERRKLRSMKTRRAEIARQSTLALQACQAQLPAE